MTITHHLDDSTLMACAAGTLPAALAVVAASHIAVCPLCREGFARAERIGAVLFDGLAPVPLSREIPVPPLDDLGAADVASDISPVNLAELPGPLARVVGRPLDSLPWRWLGPGLQHHRVPLGRGAGELRIIKAGPGCDVPAHGHNGMELTLMLRGSYQDELGGLRVGDISDLDESVEHHPIADASTGCVCVLASERPARFHGWLARLMQPFTGL
jgi:putative transcriptional regulator